MSLAGDVGYHHSSLSSADEGNTCSWPFALKLSESDIILEDFDDGTRNTSKPSETDITVDIDFENGRRGKLPLAETDCHSGNGESVGKDSASVDLEEGEIQDMSNAKSVEAYSCRYYQKGSCVYGKACRFFHLSDKGLYNMLDFPSAVTKSVHCPNQFVPEQKYICVPPAADNLESAWDRALEEAMARVRAVNAWKKKVPLSCEKLRMTIQSGKCIDDSLPATESVANDRHCKSLVVKVRDSSRSKKASSCAALDAKPRSNGRARPSGATYRLGTRNLKRSKTPNHLRWSPKSASRSSRSRSRSHSSCTSSPRRDSHVKSFRVLKKYRKRCTSSSSESLLSSYAFKEVLRRTNSRSRGNRSRLFKRPIALNRRSPVKILLPGELENACSRSSRRDVPRRPSPSEHQLSSKLVSLQSRSNNRSYSDMSISPVSDSLHRKDDHPAGCPLVGYSSDRNVSDMSISPLSDACCFDRFSDQADGIMAKVFKSNVKNRSVDAVQKGSRNGAQSTKSGPPGKISRKIYQPARRNVPNPAARTRIKKSDPLLKDLMKFHGGLKRSSSFKVTKNVPSKTPATTDASQLAVGLAECDAVGKIKRSAYVNRNKPSKKEILLRRLYEINAAIERKKMFVPRDA